MIVFELFCIANNTSNQDFLIKIKETYIGEDPYGILFLNEDLLIIMGICVLLAIIIATARPMPQKLCNLIIITSTLKD